MEIKTSRQFYYKILPNESLKELCEKFNSSTDNILRNNSNLNLYAGEWVKVDVNNFFTHIAKPMETLDDVAKKFNVGKEKLVQDNQLETDKLFIGQSIKIYK
ncbi:MAG: LysM peptidoglycan-binding domain-containing protein [Clostridia bacterium]|nr:LysM peptidoglycan-binding domain-containing protein [Clostridia bacterium]